MEILSHKGITAFIIVSMALISGCDVTGGLEQSILISDPSEREIFIKKLQDNQVFYRIGDKGHVWYKVRDSQKIYKVNSSIHPELKYVGRNIRFKRSNSDYADDFISVLNEQEIFFERINKDDVIILGFKEKDYEKVGVLFEEWQKGINHKWISSQTR